MVSSTRVLIIIILSWPLVSPLLYNPLLLSQPSLYGHCSTTVNGGQNRNNTFAMPLHHFHDVIRWNYPSLTLQFHPHFKKNSTVEAQCAKGMKAMMMTLQEMTSYLFLAMKLDPFNCKISRENKINALNNSNNFAHIYVSFMNISCYKFII